MPITAHRSTAGKLTKKPVFQPNLKPNWPALRSGPIPLTPNSADAFLRGNEAVVPEVFRFAVRLPALEVACCEI
jgi:hypothetical protein